MDEKRISIDALIEIVYNGGSVKTGIDVFNKYGFLMMGKDVTFNNINILQNIKKSGVLDVPIKEGKDGGVWDGSGNKIVLKSIKKVPISKVKSETILDLRAKVKSETILDLRAKIKQINEEKKEASLHYKSAQKAIKTIFSDIKQSDGIFDTAIAENTVRNVVDYISQNNNAVAYLINEILSYDAYLHNHSVNVCILATAVLNRFEDHYNEIKIDFLSNDSENMSKVFNPVSLDHHQMAVAFFLHDVGKVYIDESILKKEGKLTPEEFDVVKKHSYEKGLELLQKNNMNNIFAKDIVAYHHGPLYHGEKNCYPNDKTYTEIPPYVKICKLADIYDAKTSKRCYKEAQNPVGVVSDIFNSYVNKDKNLQLILHSFVNIIGLCPPGSIVLLSNGQLAYVLEGNGPIVIPFTDDSGTTLTKRTDPINFSDKNTSGELTIDRRLPIVFPVEVYNKLPPYLRSSVQ